MSGFKKEWKKNEGNYRQFFQSILFLKTGWKPKVD